MLILVGIFAGLALLTRLICIDEAGSSSFWPANAAIVVAVLLLPARWSAAASLGCFGINLALNTLTSYSLYDSCLFSTLNVAVSYLAAFLSRSLCGAATDLTRFRRLSMFGLIAFASAGCEAAVGELCGPGGATHPDRFLDGLQWTLCDGFGMLLATPAILLAMRQSGEEDPCDAAPMERWMLLIGSAVLSLVSFSFDTSSLFLVIYPALILTAFRAGPSWVFASVLLTAMIASGMTAHGLGPLARLSSSGALLREDMVQPYLISLFLSAVPANNALGEKRRTMRRLRLMKTALEHIATHDGLTALVNRELFHRRLKAALQSGAPCAVLLIDLDHFKDVNDTMGHQAGDELLRAFSARLAEAAWAAESVARLGGDEFAVLMTDSSGGQDPYEVALMIADAARRPFDLGRGVARVSASIGVALASGGTPGVDEFLRQADMALYAVKGQGRNGCRVFSEDLDSGPTARVAPRRKRAAGARA